jgi:hypothetical protein
MRQLAFLAGVVVFGSFSAVVVSMAGAFGGVVAAVVAVIPATTGFAAITAHFTRKWRWTRDHTGGWVELTDDGLVICQPGVLLEPARLTATMVSFVVVDLNAPPEGASLGSSRRDWTGKLIPPEKGRWALLLPIAQVPNTLIGFETRTRVPHSRWRIPPTYSSSDTGWFSIISQFPKPLPIEPLSRGSIDGLYLRFADPERAVAAMSSWARQVHKPVDGCYEFWPPVNAPRDPGRPPGSPARWPSPLAATGSRRRHAVQRRHNIPTQSEGGACLWCDSQPSPGVLAPPACVVHVGDAVRLAD